MGVEGDAMSSGGPKKSVRVWLAGGATLAVLVAGTVVWFGFLGGDDGEGAGAKCGARPDPATGVTAGADEPADGESLRVVDSGFWTADPDDATDASYGFLLENPSQDVAYGVELDIRVVDSDGEPALHPEFGEEPLRERYGGSRASLYVPVVLPGEQVGLGGAIQTWKSGLEDPDTGSAYSKDSVDYDDLRIEVEILDAEWWPVDNDVYGFVSVEADQVRLTETDRGAIDDIVYNESGLALDQEVYLEFELDSAGCEATQAHYPSVLLYDEEGDIVGGYTPAGRIDASNELRAHTSSAEYPPGTSTQEGHLRAFTAGADHSRVEVFPYAEPIELSAS